MPILNVWDRIPPPLARQQQAVVKRENICVAWCSWVAGFVMKIDWMGRREKQGTPVI
jgi:hypothetical protein